MRLKYFSWRRVELTWHRHSIGWTTGHKWEWWRTGSRTTVGANDNHFYDRFVKVGTMYFWHSELCAVPLWLREPVMRRCDRCGGGGFTTDWPRA